MEERFLFNGIQMKGTRIAVDQAVVFAIPILPYAAIPPFSFGYPTAPRAQFAPDRPVFQGRKIGGELCLNQTFLRPLGLRRRWKALKLSNAHRAESCPKKLQEIPFAHSECIHARSNLWGARIAAGIVCAAPTILNKPGAPVTPFLSGLPALSLKLLLGSI